MWGNESGPLKLSVEWIVKFGSDLRIFEGILTSILKDVSEVLLSALIPGR